MSNCVKAKFDWAGSAQNTGSSQTAGDVLAQLQATQLSGLRTSPSCAVFTLESLVIFAGVPQEVASRRCAETWL